VKPKHKRLSFVVIGMALLTAAAILILFALNDSVVFFYSPSDLAEQDVQPDRRFRLGGLVEENSVVRADDGVTTTFRVTDLASTVSVSFRGLLPDLFREGQGVVAEGQLDAKGVFVASEVLAKHDENYMPPEVAEALRKSGQWQGDEGKKQ
jgi:cytochrome c-type biogenesis protein CcmE